MTIKISKTLVICVGLAVTLGCSSQNESSSPNPPPEASLIIEEGCKIITSNTGKSCGLLYACTDLDKEDLAFPGVCGTQRDACYATANCARNDSGVCEFVMDGALSECLKKSDAVTAE